MRGHIRKRGNKYAIVVYLGKNAEGKKDYTWYSGYEKEKDAENDLPRILLELQNGIADPR